jgi:hypothetical protein
LALTAGIAGVASDAFAQQPSQAQINAIRQSCRSDYMAHCSSVTPGGPAALHCLQQHASSLSGACQQAVAAIKAPAPAAKAKAPAAKTETAAAPAATPPAETAAPAAAPAAPAAPAKAAKAPASKKAQLAAVAGACGADYRTHCHGIRPGTGAAAECLKRNAATLSPHCQQALMGVAAAKSKLASAPAATPAAAPVKAEPPPLLVSPREEIFLLRVSCRRDYMQFCRGLRFGAGRVASCLNYNAANLSPPCQQALAALREGR